MIRNSYEKGNEAFVVELVNEKEQTSKQENSDINVYYIVWEGAGYESIF